MTTCKCLFTRNVFISPYPLLLPATKLGQGNIVRSVCQEFCPRGGGGSQHALQVSRPTPGGGRLRGLAGGVSRPIPRGEVEGSGWGGRSPGPHPWQKLRGLAREVSRTTPRGGGCVSQHALRQTPPSRQLLLCILVIFIVIRIM